MAARIPPGQYSGPYQCPDCGQTHPKGCRGHSNIRDDDGHITGKRPCGLSPVRGLTVCHKHGGSAPQAKAKSARATEQQQADQAAAREVRRLGARTDVHPAVALIELVQLWSGHVAYWSQVVTDLEATGGHDALTWGVAKTEKGRDRGEKTNITTEQAGAHIAYQMLERASARLESSAAAALRAGVDERKVRLAESQGAAVAAAQRAILDRMFGAVVGLLREQGVSDDMILDALRIGWAEAMGVIVPEELRRLTVVEHA